MRQANRDTPTLIAGAVAIAAFATAAVLFTSPGPESLQRLGLLFALLGVMAPAILGALKAGEAAVNTNGKLDARIEAAVHRANAARRNGDEPMTPQEVDDAQPAELQRRLDQYVDAGPHAGAGEG